ncbi:MAG: restriction endonuclease [Cyclobacteriaceae bacterium]|nr:restriction endonuclease [Cyclobacteriaceae bacterium]
MRTANSIVVYEHESLKADNIRLTTDQLKSLQAYYGEKGVPFFSLIHNGVKFNEYVGVIQVGNTTIEVLPKADKQADEATWRTMLISMLKATGIFEVRATSSSSLKLRANSILDLYFELFLSELEGLLHRGLVKKYRTDEGNCKTLKGSILFPKHLRQNVLHKERFYVRHTAYDVHHQLHEILYKALKLVQRINTNPLLFSRAATLSLWFPEMDDIRVSESTFTRLHYDRKTEPYRKSMEIARLLLLNFHPDLSRGSNHVLALMFDMNLLWERFIYISLFREFAKTHPSFHVHPQARKRFWKPEMGYTASIRPDIVVETDGHECVVLDTKWKNLQGQRPADDDLKQLFVYHKYFTANKVALVYPGEFATVKGNYFDPDGNEAPEKCSLIGISVQHDVGKWQKEIGENISSWMQSTSKQPIQQS